ncbi:DUF6628 family protein [Sphingomonas sp. ID0503]|uniref:DUF6628 family protein n=1 Tax=Sphingomonas sp. ID0503 TaxID=3399691 RepID=UPI003AFB7F09
MTEHTAEALLPRTAAPMGRADAVLLFAIRRMALEGLNDAHASNALIGLFGMSYRRPQILLRALMTELARASAQTIHVAPCCCMRMTEAEAKLMRIIAISPADVRAAHTEMASVLGTFDCLGAVTSAQALGQAYTDLGKPLTRT